MAMDEQVLYVVRDGVLSAIDARTCSLRWTAPKASVKKARYPVVAGDSLILVDYPDEDANLSAIRKTSGVYRWLLMDRYDASVAPAVIDGIVYASNRGLTSGSMKPNSIVAYDATSGKFLWELLLGHGTITPPVIHGRMIYVGEGSHVTGIDRLEKRVRWTTELEHEEDEVGRSLAVAEGKLFVVDTYGTLYALGK
jgi:outer membrane protein assembly factor BamB